MANLLSGLALRYKVLGAGRLFKPIQNIHGEGLQVIRHTGLTEDLHYYAPSGQLFGASEGDDTLRNAWFPPLLIWKDPTAVGRGTIVVIDVETQKARRLILRNFNGPFNTHGIDIIADPNDPKSIFIVAVNHLPNPAYYNSPRTSKDSSIPKARSRLELFHHRVHSSEATHIRSIWHPLIRTPNDVLFKSPEEIYVTNDHYHREGPLRLLEEVSYGSVGESTDLIHLKLNGPLSQVDDDTIGVTGAVANIIDMNNGLGHGRTPDEIMVVRASIGQLLLAHVDEQHSPRLHINETIQLPSTLDNPSYFSDPYAEITGRDASGYVLAGLARAIAFPLAGETIPVMVWLVHANGAVESDSWKGKKATEKWSTRLIFQDDGRTVRTASTAILVAINPIENDGRKQAHLFVTGPLAKGVVVTKVDL